MKLQDDTAIGVIAFAIVLVLALFLFARGSENAPDPCQAAPQQDYSNIQGC